MTKPKLLLLSWEYPYMPGEASFIEPELPALTARFDVRIAACLNDGTSIERPVACPVPYGPAGKGKKLPAIFGVLTDPYFYGDLARALRAGGGPGKIRRRLGYVFYCYLHAHRFAASLKRTFKTGWTPDVGYSFWGREGAYALALLKKSARNLHAVSRFHGFDLYPERSVYGFLPFRSALHRNLDQLYFISGQGLAYDRTHMPGYDSKLRLALLGCLSTEARIAPDFSKLVIVSCSRAAPEKRLELLIDALSKIDGIPISWHHIGGGAGLEALREKSMELLSQKEAISFTFHGPVKNSGIRPLYQSIGARLLINVSSSEGLPVTMMEAFSMGLPVMGTDVGGVREIVTSGTGILLNANPSPDEIALALTNYARMDRQTFDRMSRSAYRLWAEKLDAEKNAEAFSCELLHCDSESSVLHYQKEL